MCRLYIECLLNHSVIRVFSSMIQIQTKLYFYLLRFVLYSLIISLRPKGRFLGEGTEWFGEQQTRVFLGNLEDLCRTSEKVAGCLRLRLHGAIYRPYSFVLMLRYCANLKAIRCESTSLNRIVADKSHRVIVALNPQSPSRIVCVQYHKECL